MSRACQVLIRSVSPFCRSSDLQAKAGETREKFHGRRRYDSPGPPNALALSPRLAHGPSPLSRFSKVLFPKPWRASRASLGLSLLLHPFFPLPRPCASPLRTGGRSTRATSATYGLQLVIDLIQPPSPVPPSTLAFSPPQTAARVFPGSPAPGRGKLALSHQPSPRVLVLSIVPYRRAGRVLRIISIPYNLQTYIPSAGFGFKVRQTPPTSSGCTSGSSAGFE